MRVLSKHISIPNHSYEEKNGFFSDDVTINGSNRQQWSPNNQLDFLETHINEFTAFSFILLDDRQVVGWIYCFTMKFKKFVVGKFVKIRQWVATKFQPQNQSKLDESVLKRTERGVSGLWDQVQEFPDWFYTKRDDFVYTEPVGEVPKCNDSLWIDETVESDTVWEDSWQGGQMRKFPSWCKPEVDNFWYIENYFRDDSDEEDSWRGGQFWKYPSWCNADLEDFSHIANSSHEEDSHVEELFLDRSSI